MAETKTALVSFFTIFNDHNIAIEVPLFVYPGQITVILFQRGVTIPAAAQKQ
jgi:hypothetical protein